MRKVNVYYGDVYAGQLVELSRGKRIFPVFTNMLPEGANRRALCRARKVDENDFFGMLEMICGMDAIGKFVLKRPEE